MGSAAQASEPQAEPFAEPGDALASHLAADIAAFHAENLRTSVRRLRLLVAVLVSFNLVFWFTDAWLLGHVPGVQPALSEGRLALTAVGVATFLCTWAPQRWLKPIGWLACGLTCGVVAWTLGRIGGPETVWFHYAYPFVFVGLIAWLPPGQRGLLNLWIGGAVVAGFFGADPAHLRSPVAASAIANLAFVAALAGLIGLYVDHMRLRMFLLLRERARSVDVLGSRVAFQTRHIQGLLDHVERRREEERRSLAAELHDEMGQVLTAMRCVLKVARSRPGAGGPGDLAQLALLLNHATRALRDVLGRLRPRVLDDLGLGPATEWQARQMAEASGLQIATELPTAEDLARVPDDIATVAFRVVQEALTNTVRHAQATQARISLRLDPEGLRLEVWDDGKGFEPAATATNAPAEGGLTHFGIVGMQERARALGGTATVRSASTGGTQVALALPWSSPNADSEASPTTESPWEAAS